MCPVLIEQENGPDKYIDDLRQDIFNSIQCKVNWLGLLVNLFKNQNKY